MWIWIKRSFTERYFRTWELQTDEDFIRDLIRAWDSSYKRSFMLCKSRSYATLWKHFRKCRLTNLRTCLVQKVSSSTVPVGVSNKKEKRTRVGLIYRHKQVTHINHCNSPRALGGFPLFFIIARMQKCVGQLDALLFSYFSIIFCIAVRIVDQACKSETAVKIARQ